MRLFAAIVFMMSLWIKGSAQDTPLLNLPDQLFFSSTVSYNNIYYVLDDTTPIDVFSTQNTIFSYSWSPDGSKIVIVTNEGRKITPEIYTSDFDLITLVAIELYEPHLLNYPMAWSSDSEKLFFISKSNLGVPQIVSKFLNSQDKGTELIIPLMDSEELSQIYWSPDAKYVLYQTLALSSTPTKTPANGVRQPETYRLYLFDLETQQSTLVTATSYSRCVAWSHDSQSFASISNLFQESDFPFPSANVLQIYDLDLDRLSELDLTAEPTSALGCPMAWSNDRQLIAMKSVVLKDKENFLHQTGISVVEISTGEHRALGVSDLPVYDVRSLAWSNDDSWIAIGTRYNAFHDIRLFSFATGEEFIITIDGLPLFNPQWYRINE